MAFHNGTHGHTRVIRFLLTKDTKIILLSTLSNPNKTDRKINFRSMNRRINMLFSWVFVLINTDCPKIVVVVVVVDSAA